MIGANQPRHFWSQTDRHVEIDGRQGQEHAESELFDSQFKALLVTAVQLETPLQKENRDGEQFFTFFNYGLREKEVQGPVLSRNKIGGEHIEFSEQFGFPRGLKDEAMNEAHEKLSVLDFRAVNMRLQSEVSFAIIEPMHVFSVSRMPEYNFGLNWLVDELFTDYEPVAGRRITKLQKVLQLLYEGHGYGPETLIMPELKLESDINLTEALESMGIRRAFTDDAQIANITKERLSIREVKHRATIEMRFK